MKMYKCIVCGRGYSNDYQGACKCGSKILMKIDEGRKEPVVSFKKRIENITVPMRGVFEINIESIIKSNDIIIIRDELDVYYVSVPENIQYEYSYEDKGNKKQ